MKIKLNLLLIICLLFSAIWQNTIAQDFEKTKYRLEHECYGKENATTGYCGKLAKIRKITDANKVEPDVIVEAHRGVWGGDISENTREAFKEAIDRGLYLLEADIIPVDVVDDGNYRNALSGKPRGLACFHDLVLERLTNGTGYIFNKTVAQLQALNLKKPRSNTLGTGKIMFFQEALEFATNNGTILCVDMKSLENNGEKALTDWSDPIRKKQSLIHNLKFAINGSSLEKLRHLAIKTYETYDDLRSSLLSGDNKVSVAKFNSILWVPMFAPSPKYEKNNTSSSYDKWKIENWFLNWFNNNEVVLYYETNIFNRKDGKSSRLLENIYFEFKVNTDTRLKPVTIFEGIYKYTGRRVGIFSEEPVGSRGTVNRWGKWKNKDCTLDRRGDHLWLVEIPYMKFGVITTDKPLMWDQINKAN